MYCSLLTGVIRVIQHTRNGESIRGDTPLLLMSAIGGIVIQYNKGGFDFAYYIDSTQATNRYGDCVDQSISKFDSLV